MNKKLNCVNLIDNSESDNLIHKKLIEESACTLEIVILKSITAALEYLAENHGKHIYPGMILLDIQMSDMDGRGFIEEYKNPHTEVQDTYVLKLFTSSSKIADLDKASRKHIQSYVEKPLLHG